MKPTASITLSTSPPSCPAGKPRLTPRSLYGRTRQYFTGKGQDAETGLYYYGARYLDPRAARWAGGDPALGEYIPSAPVNGEARRRNQNLPGLGGVYNTVNLHVYHYAGNNPVKYVDPDGRDIELQNDNLSNDEYEHVVKSVFNTVMNSDTDIGHKLRQIYSDSSINLTIKFGRGISEEGSYYEDGLIFIEMSQVGMEILNHPGVTATFGALIAHESGHAHADLYGYNGFGKTPLDTKAFREIISTAVENNYRAVNRLGQREVYHALTTDDELIYFDVPIWSVKTNSWTLRGQEWKMPTR